MGAAGSPLVVAVVLIYNRWDRLPRSLPALAASSHPRLHILVVDNGSTVAAPPEVTTLVARFQGVRNPRNLGFAGGNNVGIRRAMESDADYVLLLNDDAYVGPDTLARLVATMEANPSAGAVGPLVVDAANPGIVLSAGGLWSRQRQWAYHRGRGELDRGQYAAVFSADYLDGCCLLLRAAALARVGLLDEGFFLYYEEAELCARLRAAGYACLVDPSVKVHHEGPATGLGGSPITSYFSHRNRFLFLRRTSRGLPRVVQIAWALGTEVSAIRQFVGHPGDPWARARMRGILDGVMGKEGPGPAWIFGGHVPAR